ncbi:MULTISPECIES: lysozyme inhibitor LprI family protein [unclassified Serratia (in: enterobacteria)]|uniref:lysozyme inhibitor LprI family protein n=1 Tax=unclassified Serratia (in: enterobacteria) TaxID=2647522 RepID=UPI0004FFEB18|nr:MULTISPECIES: hypothetical protein [unclassified Serratia (in: enterobacteria)]KFK95370.1 hypothetical protein JV45_08400 [Serratia sp. Ag2]KFK98718.1 hypothetical protein IV04_11105 [Serratia sp. Ag1]
MRKNIVFLCFILAGLGLYSPESQAVNCQRASTPLENTICHNSVLQWLDRTMMEIYLLMLTEGDPLKVRQTYLNWRESLRECTSDNCIEQAYYKGISQIVDADLAFNWQGLWWNIEAPNMSGNTIRFSRAAHWSVAVDIRAWAGMNNDEFTAEARIINGVAFVERIEDTNSCKLLMIPRKNGSLQVFSNADWGCNISLPIGVFLDGRYQQAKSDPRPPPSLLSIGIFPTKEIDRKFRNMVGDDYQNFVNTANVFIYEDDLDNIGAQVISMWVRGAANRRVAIIMHRPDGTMWAGRIAPDNSGKLQMHYFSSQGDDQSQMPRTLVNWRVRYLGH